MSIVDYLYRGAPAGERAAVQTAVQNMPYSTIAKNIVAEGGFGKGSNLKGFDFNYKGKGALPTNTIFQKYVKNPATYIKGGLTSIFGGNAPGNIGGGTPAQRQLFEKVLQSPITKTLGPIARTTLSLPFQAVALGPYGLSLGMKPRTEAGFEFMKNFDKGAITGVMDETAGLEDFQNFANQLLAVDAANQVPANQATTGGIIDATPIFASELNAARNVGVPQDNRFTGIMRNIARGPLFSGGVKAGLTVGELLTGAANPLFALAGGLASQFLPLGRSKPAFDYQYVNQPGGVNVVDNKITTGVLAGKNFESAFGSKSLGEMYQDYIDQFEDEEDLTDFQKSQKAKAEAELRAYLTTGAKIRGYRDSVRGKTMTPREFAFNYNQGIGQFAMPTKDITGKTLDYTGESGTYAGGETTTTVNGQDITTYNDPYDPDDSYAP
jgi:hypothetical protein